MKSNSWIFFFLGVLAGGAGYWTWEQLSTPNLHNPEIALGEMCFSELQKYPPDWSMNAVVTVMQELSQKKRTPQSPEKRDDVLLEYASRESEKMAQENLLKATAFLNALAKQDHITPVVNGKVYIETLQEGTGQEISTNDRVSVFFKQYNIQGDKIKDTQGQEFTIPLSRMIKGFKLGMQGAKEGETRKIYIHPEYGFGKAGRGDEPNQLLTYEVTILKVVPR